MSITRISEKDFIERKTSELVRSISELEVDLAFHEKQAADIKKLLDEVNNLPFPPIR